MIPRLKSTSALCILILVLACQTKSKDKEVESTSAFEQPNILWLVVEDMGPYIPSFGDSTVFTPNLSKLASEGIRYTHVFSPSGVCAPSRAAIATGMYPTSIGASHMRTHSYTEVTGLPPYEAIPPPQVKMFSELLRSEGYFCTNNAKNDYQFKAPVTAWDQNAKNGHWRNRNPEQPFFSIFNIGVTHESGLFEPYEREEVIPKDTPFPIPPYLPDTEVVRHDLWKMYNNIALMDRQVGEILEQLEADGLLESTIIFFYADHGGPLPRQKRLVYDSGLNVPMIIRFPDKSHAGTSNDQLISFIDFAPTMLTLTGQTPPEHLQGQTFMGDQQPRQYIHGAADRFDGVTDAIRAVRDQRFKYVRNYRPEQGNYLANTYRERIPTMQELLRMRDNGQLNETQMLWFSESKPKEELYDCVNDPHEINNLVQNPEYAQKLQELSSEMDRWLAEIGDQPNLPERELIDQLWQGANEQPVTAKPVLIQVDNEITMECKTEGASIGYRIMGDDPATPWKIYTAPFKVQNGTQLEIEAHRIGFKPSEVIQFQVSF
ncbi:sulfatase-like hydrolase/transferase [Flagellimonas sp. S3867]|uniref:sulfatase-like hydrolase/transferase n=1 Tax=Flagellimonas sp. S3867 TaxID=2768063 RepID=UPI00168402C0|nr:sulfatase-like hydrolase/transferase [Flagellimonas sp. S3867]